MSTKLLKMLVQPGKKNEFSGRNRLSMSNKTFRDALSEAKSDLDTMEIPNFINKFSEIPYYNKDLLFQHPFPKKIEDMAHSRLLYNSQDLLREIIWTASIISNFSAEINKILYKRKKINRLILKGCYKDAKIELDEMEKEFGYSYWLLENKMFLIHNLEGLEKHKEYVNGIKNENRKINGLIKYILNYNSAKVEDNVPFDKYELIIKEALFWNKEQKISEATNNYLKFKLLDNSTKEKLDFIPITIFESNTPLIDRYINLIKVLKRLDSDDENKKIISNVREILTKIDDDESQRLLKQKKYNNINFIELVDMYTVGNYQEFLEMSKKELMEKPELIDLYPLFVKARIYSNNLEFKIFQEESLIDSILDKLSNIYLSNNKFDESYSELVKITYIFHNEVWASQLRGLIDEARTSKNKQSSDVFQRIYLENLLPDNPLSIIRQEKANKEIENYFIEVLDEYETSSTLNLYNNYYSYNDEDLKVVNIPEYRKKSFLGRILFLKGCYKESQVIYEELSESANELISLEGKVGLIECYIKLKEFLLAVQKITEAYVNSKVLIRQFPIKELINEIENDEYDEKLREDISLSILYDIYSKNFSTEKDYEKADACEDFLLIKNLEKPSDINFKRLEKEIDKNLIVYYLKNITVENVIDSFPVFNNTGEVENERIAICRILSEHDNNNSQKYQEEIKKITQKQIIKRGLEEVEKSKIYVDAEGIKTSLYKTNKESYQRYIALLKANIDDSKSGFFQLEENLDYEGQLIDLMIPTDEKTQLLYRMVFDTRDSFVSSNEYGLDGYLSVGIRHGTLSGQLRAPLEQEFLITQKDSESGKYILADIWKNKYMDSQIRLLVNGFDKFGKTIDDIILKLRTEWIQIRTEKNERDGLFNFIITVEELDELKSKVDVSTSYDEFMDMVFELLWKKTDTSLLNIRRMIREDLKVKFDDAFSEFLIFLDRQKNELDVVDIKSRIAKAQTTIQYELTKVSNWFKRNDASETSDYSVDLPINIAMEWIKNIYNEQQIKFIEKEITDFKLKGRTLKSFSDIAFILFDNIIKHSKVSGEIPTGIKLDKVDDVIILSCSNQIDSSLVSEDKKKELDALKNKINKETDYQNVKIEGGSGFYKIKKIVSVDMGYSSNINFEYDENIFGVEIKIKLKEELNEGINNRR